MLETGETSRECFRLLIVGETVTVPPLFCDEVIDEVTIDRMLEVGLDVLNIEFGIFCKLSCLLLFSFTIMSFFASNDDRLFPLSFAFWLEVNEDVTNVELLGGLDEICADIVFAGVLVLNIERR